MNCKVFEILQYNNMYSRRLMAVMISGIMKTSAARKTAPYINTKFHMNAAICTKGNARCQASHGATKGAFSCDNKECS
jgi:hypothetical protein